MKKADPLWPTTAKRAGKRRVVRDTPTKKRLEDFSSASAEETLR